MVVRRNRSRLTRSLAAAAQERFDACEVCLKNEAFEFIDEVVVPLRLKQRELERLLGQLRCPRCESTVCSGTLVVATAADQLRQARMSRKFNTLYRSELETFREFLIEYPMLGAEHPFGRVLSNAMKRAKKTVVEPSDWYHATTYSSAPIFEPRTQAEAIKANRYNQIGQAAWYLGSDEKTAAVEKLRDPQPGKPICIAKVRILEPIVVLDLRTIGQWILRNAADSGLFSERASDIEDTRPEYRVPQFVADLARRGKYRGILYHSTRQSAYNNPEAVGHNLVVFDPKTYLRYHLTENEAAFEFWEPDYDVMLCAERWPLRPVAISRQNDEPTIR